MADARRPRHDHVEPLWDRIERNRIKTAAFLAGFVLAEAVMAGLVVAILGGFLGVVLVPQADTAVFFNALPYLVAGSLVLGAGAAAVHVARKLNHPERGLPEQFGAVRSETGTMLATKSALHDMAIAAGREHSPALWVIGDCDRVNAFAVGLSEGSAVVGVTQGFADRLSLESQRAVFANLMARLRAGDTMSATVISAIMGPIWAHRDAELRRQEEREQGPQEVFVTGNGMTYGGGQGRAAAAGGQFLLAFLAVFLTELLMAGHERAALVAAEKADAEGMLLLKDPAEMLRGLEDVLGANNTVVGAGEAYSMLFFCWAGSGYAPEDDPEMRRIGRLREVLGAEGAEV